jgi:predicted nucleic acid-binding protein
MAQADAAVDTSVVVALIMAAHEAHALVVRAVGRRRLALPLHALAESYSVLTRLPGDARVGLDDAVRLLDGNFCAVLAPEPDSLARIHSTCAKFGIGGGAMYDALIALAARDHRIELLTRDRRAEATYQRLGIAYSLIGGTELQ